jgi:hypothetical protein
MPREAPAELASHIGDTVVRTAEHFISGGSRVDYLVVEKQDPDAEEVARETDPRT